MNSIYLDHAASTPVHPEVAQEMMNVMTGQFGNASSVHAFGRSAKRTVGGARDKIAKYLGCHPDELVFRRRRNGKRQPCVVRRVGGDGRPG